jgi:hypothetical protein
MFRRPFIVLAALLAPAILVAADAEPVIAPNVVHASTWGQWADDGHEGHYRFIAVRSCSPEHCSDKLFLQWVAVDATGFSIHRSRDITQGVGWAVLETEVALDKATGFGLRISFGSSYDSSTETRWVSANPDGTYEVTAASE